MIIRAPSSSVLQDTDYIEEEEELSLQALFNNHTVLLMMKAVACGNFASNIKLSSTLFISDKCITT